MVLHSVKDTVSIKDIKTIAVGAADKLGNYDVKKIDVNDKIYFSNVPQVRKKRNFFQNLFR